MWTFSLTTYLVISVQLNRAGHGEARQGIHPRSPLKYSLPTDKDAVSCPTSLDLFFCTNSPSTLDLALPVVVILNHRQDPAQQFSSPQWKSRKRVATVLPHAPRGSSPWLTGGLARKENAHVGQKPWQWGISQPNVPGV